MHSVHPSYSIDQHLPTAYSTHYQQMEYIFYKRIKWGLDSRYYYKERYLHSCDRVMVFTGLITARWIQCTTMCVGVCVRACKRMIDKERGRARYGQEWISQGRILFLWEEKEKRRNKERKREREREKERERETWTGLGLSLFSELTMKGAAPESTTPQDTVRCRRKGRF